tara:strand:- start:1056 stop:1409 length:354 start_codon:yes stop_codon:yes gene_type:complete
MSNAQNEQMERILSNEWTLYDQILYGGLGYGHFCVPKNLIRIIFTIIFPPLGVSLKYIQNDFPYIDFGRLLSNFDKIITCFVLTSLFYVPGLIYGLNQLQDDPSDETPTDTLPTTNS